MSSFKIKANITDLHRERIYFGEIVVRDGFIEAIAQLNAAPERDAPYLLPGFIDSHIHIESSMLVPAEFAKLAVVHGTVATVSDPHEIANVCGMSGIQFMIDNGNSVNFKFHFGAPSCVPATSFETAGDTINAENVKKLLAKKEILYLSEMMNFPGVIYNDEEVLNKIAAAVHAGKPVDGHAPGLRGDALAKYIAAGISTDHECFTKEEALEKLSLGMKVIIREGSAAKNFEALIDLLEDYPDEIMFCSDDKHPDSLVKGHINELCQRAVAKNIDVFKVLKAACINPIIHYRLGVGMLRRNDPADFIVIEDLKNFNVISTYINGVCVAEKGRSNIQTIPQRAVNRFNATPVTSSSLICTAASHLVNDKLPVIEALDGQLITNKIIVEPSIVNGNVVGNVADDILKLVVINRYQPSPPAISFIKNFSLTQGAIASSVAHDSHNIISVGADDDSIARAINLVIGSTGGISLVNGNMEKILPLPVAGLMSLENGYAVAAAYTEMDQLAKSLGSKLAAPYMTLSFMALLVIPSLKLSDKGLFDGNAFRFVYS